MSWSPNREAPRGRVAVVAGATRGAGPGIAAALGEGGATVICTGHTTYDLAKIAVTRLAFSQGHELAARGASAVALTPEWLRSNFGMTEENWREAVDPKRAGRAPSAPPDFALFESPRYVGRAVAALAADPDRARSNQRSLSCGQLACEPGFTDLDGSRPDIWRDIEEVRERAATVATNAIARARAGLRRRRGRGYNRRMRPTLVLLVRHGQTPTTGKVLPGQAPGLHLAEEGQRQANVVAARIDKLPKVAAVYASQLERARETAMPIARTHGLAVRIDRDLADGDVGEWTGQKLHQLARKPEWQIVQRHPSGFRFPGGESFPEMQTRVVSALSRIVERHPGAVVVAVSHADPIKAALAHALGIHLDLFQRIMIAPCSVTAIGYHRHGPVVLTVNSVDGDLGWLGGK